MPQRRTKNRMQIASQSVSLEPTGFQSVKLVSFSDVKQSFCLWFNDNNLLVKSSPFTFIFIFFSRNIHFVIMTRLPTFIMYFFFKLDYNSLNKM